MSEDSRIREIRAALSLALAHLENAITCDGVDLATEVLEGRLAELLDSAPPAPRVWFPGEMVPAMVPVVNHVGGVWRHHADRPVKTGYALEIVLPSPEERDHAAAQARADRPEVQP